jgi:hypothetical protein
MRILIIYTVSILLAAVADGCMDTGVKMAGHSLESLSILALLIVPFIQKYRGGWGWYIAAYLCLRVGMFDLAYNIAAGLPLTFHGTTSLWDGFVQAFNPPMWAELFGRAVFLFAGVMIAIQQIKYEK